MIKILNKPAWGAQIQDEYRKRLERAEAEFLERMGYAEADGVDIGIFLGAKCRIRYYEADSGYARSRHALVVSIDIDLDDNFGAWHASLGLTSLDGISEAAYLCFRSYEDWSLYCGVQQYLIDFAWL